MAGTTLADAQTALAAWLAADLALAKNQSYSLPDGRTLTRADGATVAERIAYWQGEVDKLSRGTKGRRVRQAAVR